MKSLKFSLLVMLLSSYALIAMEAPSYQYRDESNVQDKRKIAVLSYGSLVKQPVNQQTGARLETAAPFAPTTVSLPVNLSRLSGGNRITAVIDTQGDPKRVWAAPSRFAWLPNARNNVAAREGSPFINQTQGHDLKYIFYMKKLLGGRAKDNNEEVIPGTDRWVIRAEANERQRLPQKTAQALARWADQNGYTALIWASFPPTFNSRHAIIERLLADANLLRNTQAYVQNLPDGPQSGFERAIMAH